MLAQIVQNDERHLLTVRELTQVCESLGRWRDLFGLPAAPCRAEQEPEEKVKLYRAAARRWMKQFSNVQNAVGAYEALLEVDPNDAEAHGKLKELYLKRRSWPQLYALYQRQVQGAAGHAKVELLVEMAKLAAERLDRGGDAIVLYKQLLVLEPGTPGILDALEKQAEREKDFATVAEVLERRVDASGDDSARLVALQKLGTVYAERVRDPGATARHGDVSWLSRPVTPRRCAFCANPT